MVIKYNTFSVILSQLWLGKLHYPPIKHYFCRIKIYKHNRKYIYYIYLKERKYYFSFGKESIIINQSFINEKKVSSTAFHTAMTGTISDSYIATILIILASSITVS